jgi:RNA polymerase sigma-70 factor (ECF subfamily)
MSASRQPLSRLLAGFLDPGGADELARIPDLEARLRSRLGEARAAWPGVSLGDEEFLRYVAERIPAAENLAASLDSIGWSELYLTCASGRGDSAALVELERVYFDEVPAALAHMRLSASDVDEVKQALRQKLFVAEPGQRPKIDDYAGRGSLRGLLRVIAVRTAITALRKQQREELMGDDLLRLGSQEDAELEHFKRQYRDQFATAFAEAVEALTRRERTLVRLHLLDGVTLDQLAVSYSVHRATIARWLARARQTLLAETRRRLRARLSIGADELEDFVGLIESRLDLSLRRLLATQDRSA